MEILVELVVELLFEVVGQVAIEFGWESIAHVFHGRRKANPVLAGVGILLLGGTLGLVASFLVPKRLLPPSRVPALSLLVAPLIAGSIMKALGDWRRARGGDPSVLATFWGGALFAFALALARWLMVGRVG
jgi:hypothetical protein